MAEKKKLIFKLQCQECKRYNYWRRKGKKQAEQKLNLKKFCKHCKKHTPHKEIKK